MYLVTTNKIIKYKTIQNVKEDNINTCEETNQLVIFRKWDKKREAMQRREREFSTRAKYFEILFSYNKPALLFFISQSE